MPSLSIDDRIKEQSYLTQITEDCIKIAKELGWGSESEKAWQKKKDQLNEIVFHELRNDKITPLKKAILKKYMEETKGKKDTEKYDFSGNLKVENDNLKTSELNKFKEKLQTATKSK